MEHKTKKKKKVKILPYMLIVPILVGTAMLSLYPFAKTIISSFSFTTSTGDWLKWAGTTFWNYFFTKGDFSVVLKNTFVFALMNFTFTFIIGMTLALLSAHGGKLSSVYQTLYALPMAISSASASVAWKFILKSDGGLLNSWFGTNIDWLTNPDTVMWVVALVTAWAHVGITYLYLLAGFRNVSDDVLEAARVDGANAFVRAYKIMIPIASPQIFFVIFLNILTAMKTFTQIRMLTEGGPGNTTTTIMYYIYKQGSLLSNYELACCGSIVMFLLIFVVTRIQFLCEKKFVHYE